MKKAKRILCIIMTAVIIATAPMASYMEAHAVEVIALPLVEELLLSLGISLGFGTQNEFSSQLYENNLEDYFNAAVSGGTFTLPEYGTVDFSDGHSVLSLMDWCMKVNLSLLTGDPSHMDSPLDSIDAAYADAALKMDLVSYHNTGTSATNAMNDSISEFYDDYNGISEALAEDIQECFTVILSGGDFNDDDDDEEEKTARRKRFWKIFSAVTSAGMIGFGNTALPLAALKEYGNSEFSEYDAVFGDTYFDGKFDLDASGRYQVKITCSNTDDKTLSYYEQWFCEASYGFPVVGVIDNSTHMVYFYTLDGSSDLRSCMLGYRAVKNNGSDVTSSAYQFPYYNFSCNIPLYSSLEAALNALVSDSFLDAENIQSSYADFKSNTKGANSVVGNAFSNYVASLRSLSDIIDIIPGITEASDTYGGTAEALKAVSEILNRAASVPGTNPDPDVDDPSSSSGSYSGILGKILTAINNLPGNILNKFVSKFMTAEGLTKLINNLPSLFVEAFSVMLSPMLNPIISTVSKFITAEDLIKLINNLPSLFVEAFSVMLSPMLNPIISTVSKFITAEDLTKLINNLPSLFVEAFSVIINPDLNPVISAIKAVPDGIHLRLIEIFPNSETVGNAIIGFPDDIVEAFKVFFDDENIGLGDIITNSIEDTATKLFVPEEGPALEKIDDMKEYFKFKDDMEVIIYEFKKNIFGIKPSPVLKIPIGKPTSKKYNFGTGSYIIIDVSWYAKYKDFGDKIILAFAWAFFIWRIFVHLPGIISGGVGGIQSIGDAYIVYKKNGSGD